MKNSFIPLIVRSWTILSEETFVKRLDKSSFLHRGTGIPKNIKVYWKIDTLEYGDQLDLNMIHDHTTYKMKITCDQLNRTRLFWNSDFEAILKVKYNNLYNTYRLNEENELHPEMKFSRIDKSNYSIEFVESVYEYESIEEEIVSLNGRIEGKKVLYYTEKYERNSTNRKLAVQYHGYRCKACDFLFKEKYGKRGDKFIEIHHIKPLYINNEEVIVDPQKDLVPVCSNCHKMIHRKRHDVLSIERLKEMISNQKESHNCGK